MPTKTIEEVKSKVTKVWRGLPDAYLEELCTSMRRRCPGIINNNGYPTKYCMFMFPINIFCATILHFPLEKSKIR